MKPQAGSEFSKKVQALKSRLGEIRGYVLSHRDTVEYNQYRNIMRHLSNALEDGDLSNQTVSEIEFLVIKVKSQPDFEKSKNYNPGC